MVGFRPGVSRLPGSRMKERAGHLKGKRSQEERIAIGKAHAQGGAGGKLPRSILGLVATTGMIDSWGGLSVSLSVSGALSWRAHTGSPRAAFNHKIHLFGLQPVKH